MRIAILPDAYLPDSTLIHAKMLHELAVEFIRLGHDVVVITPGKDGQHDPMCVSNLNGVEVWRFRCKPTRGVSHVRRLINETLLSWFAIRAIKSLGLNTKFDLCINYSPTIFFGPLVKWLKQKGCFVYLVLRDFFPQWIIDEGLISSASPVTWYLKYFERLNYRQSDVVAVQSPANKSVFETIVGNDKYNVDVLYNWTTLHQDVDETVGKTLIKKLGLEEKCVFLYGGNVGHAQDIPNLLRLGKRLAKDPSIHMLIVGQGDQFASISKSVREGGMSNITIIPSICQEDYQSLLTQVHVGLFSLAPSHQGHNFPGKILGYLNAKLPILGSVNAGNDIIAVINETGSGKVFVNGDDDGFIAQALKLSHSKELRDQMASNGLELLKSLFSTEYAAQKILATYQNKQS